MSIAATTTPAVVRPEAAVRVLGNASGEGSESSVARTGPQDIALESRRKGDLLSDERVGPARRALRYAG